MEEELDSSWRGSQLELGGGVVCLEGKVQCRVVVVVFFGL